MPFITLDTAAAQAAPVTTLGQPFVKPLTGGMGETLDSMREELLALFFQRPEVDPNRADKWINFAYVDLCASLSIPDLFGSMPIVLTPGQPLYALPPVVSYISLVAVIDAVTYPTDGGRQLKKRDRDWYRRAPDETEEPHSFFRERDLLVLYPTPKSARTITIDFRIRPFYLVNSDHQPIIPAEWHEGIVILARSKGFKGLREFDAAAVEKNEFNDFVRRKLDTKSGEDEGRIILSSVPRSRRQLTRESRLRLNEDQL